MSATRERWGIRAFRALLAIYPGEFRDEYGREVAMVFADRYRIVMQFDDCGRQILNGLTRERLLAMLAGFFGALATILATVGLYGMISFTTAQRQQEIGIRTALGARRQQIVVMVMRDAGWLMVSGVIGGTALSLLAGRSAATLLFGLTPHDPSTLAAASLLLAIVAATASLLPASRAARLDPLRAMREE